MASTNFQVNVLEHTRISPNFIDNEDAGIYSVIATNSSTENNSSKKAAGQVYSVVHNGTAYAFCYYDGVTKFELPDTN
jgi:hypothetical protein